MLKNLMLTAALLTTAATASAEVTMDDQSVADMMTIIALVGEFCSFDLSEEADTLLVDFFAHLSSKYPETDIGDAIAVSGRMVIEQRNAAVSEEAWCAEKLLLGPEYWSEAN